MPGTTTGIVTVVVATYMLTPRLCLGIDFDVGWNDV